MAPKGRRRIRVGSRVRLNARLARREKCYKTRTVIAMLDGDSAILDRKLAGFQCWLFDDLAIDGKR